MVKSLLWLANILTGLVFNFGENMAVMHRVLYNSSYPSQTKIQTSFCMRLCHICATQLDYSIQHIYKLQVEFFWVVTPCSVVVGCHSFRGLCYLHLYPRHNQKDVELKHHSYESLTNYPNYISRIIILLFKLHVLQIIILVKQITNGGGGCRDCCSRKCYWYNTFDFYV
jgi:hypothetical protein